jgi:hypothetical protein
MRAALAAISIAIGPHASAPVVAASAQSLKLAQDRVAVRVANPNRPLGKRFGRPMSNADLQNALQRREKSQQVISNTLKANQANQKSITNRIGDETGRGYQPSNSDFQNALQGKQKNLATMSNTAKAARENRSTTIKNLQP